MAGFAVAASARASDGHEDVAVVVVGLGLAGEHGGASGRGERDADGVGIHRVDAVEQVLRVERDLHLLAVEARADRLAGLRLVAGSRLKQYLARREGQPDRGVPLGYE